MPLIDDRRCVMINIVKHFQSSLYGHWWVTIFHDEYRRQTSTYGDTILPLWVYALDFMFIFFVYFLFTSTTKEVLNDLKNAFLKKWLLEFCKLDWRRKLENPDITPDLRLATSTLSQKSMNPDGGGNNRETCPALPRPRGLRWTINVWQIAVVLLWYYVGQNSRNLFCVCVFFSIKNRFLYKIAMLILDKCQQ